MRAEFLHIDFVAILIEFVIVGISGEQILLDFNADRLANLLLRFFNILLEIFDESLESLVSSLICV